MNVGERAKFRLFIPEMHEFGGYERIFVEMAAWMRSRGVDFEVVSFQSDLDFTPYGQVDVRQILPGGGSLLTKALAFRRWAQSLESGTPPPILVSLQTARYAAYSGLPRYTLRIADTPSLLSEFPEKRTVKTMLSKRAEARGLRRASGISTDANYQVQEFQRTWGVTAAVHRIGTRPVSETFRRKFPVKGPVHVLSVCRVERSKRIEWILTAAARIRDAVAGASAASTVHVDVAGKGSYLPALKAMAESLGIADLVTFHGFVSDATLERLLEQSHLFAMPARQGYGIPALEAMGHGSPVVLDVDSGVSDILGSEPWAYVSAGTENSFAEQLTEAVRDIRAGRFDTLAAPTLPTWDGFFRELTAFGGWSIP